MTTIQFVPASKAEISYNLYALIRAVREDIDLAVKQGKLPKALYAVSGKHGLCLDQLIIRVFEGDLALLHPQRRSALQDRPGDVWAFPYYTSLGRRTLGVLEEILSQYREADLERSRFLSLVRIEDGA